MKLSELKFSNKATLKRSCSQTAAFHKIALVILCNLKETRKEARKRFKWKFEWNDFKVRLLTIPLWNNFWVVVVWLFWVAFLPPNFCNNLDELLPPALGSMLFWPRNAATEERRLRLGAFKPVIEPGKSRPRLSVGHLVLSYMWRSGRERESCIVNRSSANRADVWKRLARSGI